MAILHVLRGTLFALVFLVVVTSYDAGCTMGGQPKQVITVENINAIRLFGKIQKVSRFDAMIDDRSDVYDIAFSPDAKLLAVSVHKLGFNGVELLDSDSLKLTKRLNVPYTYSISFSYNGKLLACEDYKHHRISLMEVASGKLTDVLSYTMWEVPASMEFSPIDMMLAYLVPGGRRSWSAIKLWNIATRKTKSLKPFEPKGGRSLAFSPDGTILAASLRHTIELWHVKREERVLAIKSRGANMTFHPNGRILATSSGPEVDLWNTVSGELIARLEGHKYPVRSLSFTPKGDLLASCDSGKVYPKRIPGTIIFWDLDKRKELFRYDGLRLREIIFRPDGRVLAGKGEGQIFLFSVR